MKTNLGWKAAGAVLGAWLAWSEAAAQPIESVDVVPTDPRESAPARFERHHQEIPFFGQNVVVETNEIYQPGLVLIGGKAVVRGEVRGNVVAVLADLEIEGKVDGDVVVVLGKTDLKDSAQVRDSVVAVGPVAVGSGAAIGGDRVFIPWLSSLPGLGWVEQWLRHGLLWLRPLPHQHAWAWWITGILLLFYVLLSAVFPRPIRACAAVLEERPLATLGTGIVLLVLMGPLLLLLLVSVVGVIVMPFLACGLMLAYFFGKAAVYQVAGQQIARQLGLGVLDKPLASLVVGMALFTLLYVTPILGLLAWGAIVPVAMGAVMVALFRGLQRERGPAAVTAPILTPGGEGGSAGGDTAPSGVPAGSPAAGAPTMDSMAAGEAGIGWAESGMPCAGFWIRLLAAVIDGVVVFGALALLHLSRHWFLVWLAYHLALWSWRGTTIGGALLGLKLVRIDSRDVDFPVALVRGLSAILSAVVLGLGFFWVGWDNRRQSWHDKIAGTVIVHMPKGTPLF